MRRGRILLDDPGLVWLVEEGEASVHAEPAPAAGLSRAVREMARFGAGDVVFGLAPPAGEDRLELYLEAAPGARLTPLLAEEFTERCRQCPGDWLAPLARLTRQLAVLIHPDIPPPDVSKALTPGGSFRLQTGARMSARQEGLWFVPTEGVCVYGGADCLPPLATGRPHALAGGLWVLVRERARLVCLEPEAVLAGGHALAAVAGLSALARIMVFERFSQESLVSLAELARGVRHRRHVLGQALERTVQVAEGHAGGGDVSSSALVQAVRLTVRPLGLEIEEPPRLDPDPGRALEDTLGCNGLFSRVVRLSGGWQARGGWPLLGFLAPEGGPGMGASARQPVALVPGKKGYALRDPAEPGASRPVDDALAARLGSAAIQLYTPLPKGKPGPLALFRHGIKGGLPDAGALVLAGVASGLCGFAMPMAMSSVVDSVIPHGDTGLLTQVMLALAMFVFGGAVFELCKGFALLRVESGSQVSLQSGVMARVMGLPMGFFSRYAAGDLSTRVSAIDSIRRKLSGAVLVTLLSSAFAMSNLFLLFLYSAILGLVVTAIFGLALVAIFVLMKKQMKFQASIENSIGRMAGLELQLISGINKLKAAGAEAGAFSQWLGLYNENRRLNYSVGLGANVLAAWNAGLPLFTSLTVFGLYLLLGGPQALSLGSFLCFNTAMGQLSGAVGAFGQTAYSLMFLSASYQRLRPILEADPENQPGQEDPGQLKGAIEVSGVFFTYQGTPAPVLKGVSFKVEPGQFVAVVGESGSGKSTLLKMLLGFHDPTAGAVLYDGKALSRLDKGKVRRQIGTIIQNGELIQGNIYFNIMGASAGDEAAAWEAARIADIDKEIREMPMGLHTFVPHGGGSFSGGQKQRMLIARAVARKPRIVYFDEATSSLDNASQARVMANLQSMQATRLVVAHRLSTVENADLIVVMHQGRIVEAGTFAQLMAAKGLFARMAARQQA
jgi:ATP-binding cassette subfamily C protein